MLQKVILFLFLNNLFRKKLNYLFLKMNSLFFISNILTKVFINALIIIFIHNILMNLCIQFDSFEFLKSINQPDDTVRVTATSFPDEQSRTITLSSKIIKESHPFLSVGISELTKKIILVFQKKYNSKKDNIIGSTIIRSDQFSSKMDEKNNTEMRNILIYEPYPKSSNKNNSALQDRKVLGKMEVLFALSESPQRKNY